jgi:hypothetical protein
MYESTGKTGPKRAHNFKLPGPAKSVQKNKVGKMARTRQTVNVSKLKNIPPEELAKWTPGQRKAYWQGVFERRRARKTQMQVKECQKY